MLDKIISLAEKNNGFFTLQNCLEAGISRWQVEQLLKNEKITKVKYGVYSLPNVIFDELFVMQLFCTKTVLSHESALYYLGYSDQVPFKYTISVPQGYSSKVLAQEYDIRHVSKESATDGIILIKDEFQNDLRVYCIERTLCELLHKPSDFNKERFIPAIQKYLKSDSKNLLKLNHYAKLFHQEKKLLPYLEAIL